MSQFQIKAQKPYACAIWLDFLFLNRMIKHKFQYKHTQSSDTASLAQSGDLSFINTYFKINKIILLY